MIKSSGSNFEVTCEGPGCSTSVATDGTTFKDFIEDIKQNGWIITKDDMGWHHYCCQQCREMPF